MAEIHAMLQDDGCDVSMTYVATLFSDINTLSPCSSFIVPYGRVQSLSRSR